MLNVKILLDPKFYYQKLKELATKSTQVFSRVGSNAKKVFSAVRSGVSGATASLGTFIKSVLRGGGAPVLIEGFKSLIKIGQHFYNSWIDGMKEAAAMSEQNAAAIREAAQANEELRRKGDDYLKQQEQLASQENLSNANKEQAAKAIGELTKAYGDLGIKLDETTGKLGKDF